MRFLLFTLRRILSFASVIMLTEARRNTRFVRNTAVHCLRSDVPSMPKQRLRPLSYSKSHVILIAFAIDTPDSLDNVTVKVCLRSSLLSSRHIQTLLRTQWIEEVRSICGSSIPILLVGCKADLRPPPGSPNLDQYVSRAQGERVAQAIGARGYKECSALKIEGVDDVFEAATRASMLMREGVPTGGHHRRRSSIGAEEEDGRGWKCCVIC